MNRTMQNEKHLSGLLTERLSQHLEVLMSKNIPYMLGV